MGMHQLIPIGRFSRMTRLSVKALRHYDAIGLMTPEEVDPSSGYRYYRPVQVRRARAIRMLRGVDLPLDDIAEVLRDEADAATVGTVLDRHRERLVEDLRLQERRLVAVRRIIDGEEPLMPYDVTTTNLEPLTVLSTRTRCALDEVGAAIGAGFAEVMATAASGGAAPAGAPMVLFHDVIDGEQAGEIEVAMPVAAEVTLPAGGSVRCRVLEGGPAATTTHRGPYTDVETAYHVLADWIAEHGHAPLLPTREVYLNDPGEISEDEQLTQVQWPYS